MSGKQIIYTPIGYLLFIFILSSCNNPKNGKYCKKINSNKVICKEFNHGIMHSLISYKNDYKTKQGMMLTFSDLGDTLIKSYYSNDTLYGNYYEKYMNLKPKKYVCYGTNNKPIFYREYDTTGNITNEGGEMLIESGVIKTRLDKDSIIEFVNVCVAPPMTSTKFKKYIFYMDNISDTIWPTESYYSKDGSIHTSEFKIYKKGLYLFRCPIRILDTIKNKTYTQDESFKMNI